MCWEESNSVRWGKGAKDILICEDLTRDKFSLHFKLIFRNVRAKEMEKSGYAPGLEYSGQKREKKKKNVPMTHDHGIYLDNSTQQGSFRVSMH